MLEYILMKLTQKDISFNLNTFKEYISLTFEINNQLQMINIHFNEHRLRYYLVSNEIKQISKKELKELIDTILT